MERGTVINCLDGRIQIPVMEYLRRTHSIKYVDVVTEAGPLKVLTERKDKCRIFSLKEALKSSLNLNGSKFIAVVGHHDCRGNPVERAVQEKQMDEALKYLSAAFGEEIFYVALWVNEKWEVEEYKRMG